MREGLVGLEIQRKPDRGQWREVRDLCCLTGNAGQPIALERWEFFAQQWIGPYERLCPSWTYIVLGPEKKCVGYLTGCPDTRQFRRKYVWRILPFLLIKAARRISKERDARGFLRRFLRIDPTPERSFSSALRKHLLQDYPAHLHMNLASDQRGAGWGGRLIARLIEDLRSAQVPGVHIFCGEGPRAFYVRQGFVELDKIEFRPGHWVFAMGKKWS